MLKNQLTAEGIAPKWLSITDLLFQCKGFDIVLTFVTDIVNNKACS